MKFIFLLILLIPPIAWSQPGRGMWVWQQKAFNSHNAIKKMLKFCKKEKISHIDLHLSLKRNKKGIYEIQNPKYLKKLILEAHKQNITLNALRGNRKMFFEENHKKVLLQLEAILNFNKKLPLKKRFLGVKYDVEPYLTKKWKIGGTQKEKVQIDYLDCLGKIRAVLKKKKSKLELGVDIPFWWDKKEHEVTFKGKKKRFVSHIQDVTDVIGIMSYRRDADKVYKYVKDELIYAKKINKIHSVCPSLDVLELKGREKEITFWGRPVSEFRKTLEKLEKKLLKNKQVRLIMLHDYKGLQRYLSPKK